MSTCGSWSGWIDSLCPYASASLGEGVGHEVPSGKVGAEVSKCHAECGGASAMTGIVIWPVVMFLADSTVS